LRALRLARDAAENQPDVGAALPTKTALPKTATLPKKTKKRAAFARGVTGELTAGR
jgi:hypothetical protein